LSMLVVLEVPEALEALDVLDVVPPFKLNAFVPLLLLAAVVPVP